MIFLLGFIVGGVLVFACVCNVAKQIPSPKLKDKRLEERHRIIEKYFLCWLRDKSLAEYLKSKDVERIIIYGASDLGKAVNKSCLSVVKCICYMDRDKAKKECMGIKVIHSMSPIPEADLIIITAFDPYREIMQTLEQRTSVKIMYLEDIIDEMFMGRDK